MTVNYRGSYGAFACCGILYNHESPRRGADFVTSKITRSAARISLGLQDELVLGNLNVRRNWGHARDNVRAMWLMLQADEPDDYVITTGTTHSLIDLLTAAFDYGGIAKWQPFVRQPFVRQDAQGFPPADVTKMTRNPAKASENLGRSPRYTFEQVVHEMVDAELARREPVCPAALDSSRILKPLIPRLALAVGATVLACVLALVHAGVGVVPLALALTALALPPVVSLAGRALVAVALLLPATAALAFLTL